MNTMTLLLISVVLSGIGIVLRLIQRYSDHKNLAGLES